MPEYTDCLALIRAAVGVSLAAIACAHSSCLP